MFDLNFVQNDFFSSTEGVHYTLSVCERGSFERSRYVDYDELPQLLMTKTANPRGGGIDCKDMLKTLKSHAEGFPKSYAPSLSMQYLKDEEFWRSTLIFARACGMSALGIEKTTATQKVMR